MSFREITIAAAILIASNVASVAQESRVERISESGTITIGHPEASVPFSFLGENEQPVGYTVEICQNVAKIIGEKLGIKNINILYNPTTSSTRIPLIGNGTIDLECGNTTNKSARWKLAAFSPTIFISQIVLGTRKDTGIDPNELANFKGKSISATAGGQTFKTTTALSSEHDYDITMAGAPDNSRAFLLLESARVDGMVSDDALLYAAVATSKNPSDFVIGTKGLEFAPYGILEPKNDPKFKELVDNAVKSLMADGTVTRLYTKYFNSPIPPRNINLQYPMSEVMKNAIANPTDSFDPDDYK